MTFVMRSNKRVAKTGNSSITRSIALQALDSYSRAWIVHLDSANRLRVGCGYHGTNFTDSVIHDAYEIKTSDDPSGATPQNMATRFYIQTDKQFVDVGFNYLADLVMNHGSYERNVAWGPEFVIPTADGTQNKYIATVQAKLDDNDHTILEVAALPFSTNKNVKVRLFRDTNTSGSRLFEIMKGDGTNTTTFSVNAGTGDATVGGKLIVPSPTVPDNASSTGTEGEIAWDSNFIYICTATNTWKRVAIATW